MIPFIPPHVPVDIVRVLTNVTTTVKGTIITYIHYENCSLNLMSEAYLETSKHLRWIFLREQFTEDPVT